MRPVRVHEALRSARSAVGASLAPVLERSPSLERLFIRAGHVLRRRSRTLSTLHWVVEDHLVRRLAGGPRRFRDAIVGDGRMCLDVADHTGRTLYFHGVTYEPETTIAIQRMLGPGDTFIDVGANIGFFAVVAALRVGATGRVAAFEPHPGARARIAELATVNGVAARIAVVSAAAGARPAPAVPLHLAIDPVLSTLDPSRSPARAHYTFDRHVLVPVTTIDLWLEEHPAMARGLRLVKIDVEGTEHEVVEGMRCTLAAHRPAVICETSPGTPADALLRACGYTATPLDLRQHGHGNYLYVAGGPARTLLT